MNCMVVDSTDGVCSQVPGWTSEPVHLQQVEAAEPGKNLNLSRGTNTLTIETHGQKADLRVRQDHKMEGKADAKDKPEHGAHHTRWSLRPHHHPSPSLPAAFPLDLGLARKLIQKELNMDPKKEESKDSPRAFLNNSFLALWNNMALEKIRVREEDQFPQSHLGQSCHLKIPEAPRKVTLKRETSHNLISFCYTGGFIFSHSHLPSISFPGLPSPVY